MKKFKIRYYEIAVEGDKEYEIVKEATIEANLLKVEGNGVLFGNNTNEILNGIGIAHYSRVISAKEMK